ncbi:sensor histidine kinase [Nocardia salmonicida]|uniref:sensor histidine kinase n=1 Tax=Nocardia salmonicida TaxID=53431 RepID=UPI0036696DF4
MAQAVDSVGSPAESSFGVTVTSVLERTRAVSVVLLASVELSAAAAHLISGQGTGAGAVASTILVVWAVLRLVTARPPRWWPVRDVMVAGGYVLATPLLVDGPEFTSVATPMLAVGGTAVVATAIACSPVRSLLATGVVVCCWALGAARVPGVGNPLTIFNLDFVFIEWVMAATLHILVIRAASNTDTVQAELARAQTDAEIAGARGRAEREAWATMHDTAATTLATLAHGAHVSAPVLHAQLRRDLDILGQEGLFDDNPTVELASALAELSDSTRTPARYVGPQTMQVPAVTGRAVIAAAREALANVDRHAAANEVRIELAGDRLTITDDGVGFDSTDQSVVSRRHGIRHSIRRRLTDVGVAVAIHSAAGTGTQIVIDWHSIENTASDKPGIDHSERLLDGYGYGLVFVAILITVFQCRFGLAAAHPFAQLLILLVVVAITVVAAYESHTRVPTPLWWAAMVSAVVAGPLQLVLLEPKDLATGANWAVGALGWQIAALACRRPIRAGMTVLAMMWTAGALVVIGHGREIDASVAWVYTVISVATLQALAIWFSGVLRATVRDSRDAMTAITELRKASEVRDALHQDNLARVQQLSSQLVPLLTRLLHTDDPARDPATRAQCLIESARLRRMFDPVEFCAHPLIDELDAAISAAEHRGVTVTRVIIGDLPELTTPQRSRILTAPMILLGGARTRARVVVTGLAGQAQPPTLSITVDCSSDTREAVQALTPDTAIVAAGDLVWATIALA